jgi:CheY-like chemotaxis protein
MTVLIVDDNWSFVTSLKAIFGLLGVKVLAARSGTEALAIAGRRELHGALIDLHLPDLDGIEVFSRLAATQCFCHFCLITGYGASNLRSRALAIAKGTPLGEVRSQRSEVRTGHSDFRNLPSDFSLVSPSVLSKPIAFGHILEFLKDVQRSWAHRSRSAISSKGDTTPSSVLVCP